MIILVTKGQNLPLLDLFRLVFERQLSCVLSFDLIVFAVKTQSLCCRHSFSVVYSFPFVILVLEITGYINIGINKGVVVRTHCQSSYIGYQLHVTVLHECLALGCLLFCDHSTGDSWLMHLTVGSHFVLLLHRSSVSCASCHRP